MLQLDQRQELFSLSQSALAFASERAGAMRAQLDGLNIETKPEDENAFKVRPFGFDVHRAKREFLEDWTFMQYLSDVGTDGAGALTFCEREGIPVIAILPETVWANICVKAEIFTLWPSAEGEVYASYREENDFVTAREHTVSQKSFFGMGRTKHYDVIRRDKNIKGLRATKQYFHNRDRKALMLGLFPGYTSEHSSYNCNKINVRFPTPDAEFGKALLRLQKHKRQIGICVEAEAIDVSEYAEASIRVYEEKVEKSKKVVNERRKEAFRQLFSVPDPDPILTFRHGKVRVICAQYGKWPLELQAIKTALEQDLRMKD